jgi:hypothetical protein
MNTLWEVPAVVAALLAWMAAPPATIGEAAAREALRRELTGKATRLYTNVDLPPVVEEIADPRPAPVGSGTPGSASVAASAPPAAPAEIRDEAWWQNRVTALRTSTERHVLLADAMQTRINSLTADVVSRDDPFQRAELRLQLQQALSEFDRLQVLVIEGRRSLEDVLAEARRAGVPPGWVRYAVPSVPSQ